ncbi:methionyl-tRNA synthetase [Roseiarcus fermentans]|uniref:Methionine--tRNA ligase n=1 Tax=Roseiarcus fermentans TaxID=1473586 RepID=A0A366FT03_9HYPH|nr:methionine--tRNA ligase [Roseiarcus fermentans]RBP16865.1 methionyl-tRNA synthetase [Roseiarcus fermentans]
MSRFFITTAIPYANGAPHIGHAYERIATDAIQRFMRLDGRDTLFVTGMDEYGLKVQQTAAREGVTPQEFVDRVAAEFEAMGELLNARADDIVRTTQPRHARSVQAIWERMAANGDIYLSKYSGWYSVRDEAYFDESELTDGPEGKKLAPSGAPVDWVEEESWFFRLSAYADRLLAHYAANPDFVTPEKYLNEIVAFVKRGLSDLSISRTAFSWGVPVPGDPKHVMYVWVDALTNYITATGFPDAEAPRAKYWPADVHVIGKDITRFHAIYWPAFLMSAGLPAPKQVVVHGFLFNRGEKMSKSVGNVVSPASLVAAYGLDPVRYFFLREVPFGQDGSYSHEAIVARMNADLANDIGNLGQRSLSMIAKNGEGRVPDPSGAAPAPEDLAMLARADALIGEARRHMANFQIHLYVAAVFEVVAEANRYFANAEPWKLAKSDRARMALVLYVTIETLRIAATLLQPVMPGSMAKLLDLLAVPPEARTFAALETGEAAGRLDAPNRLEPGRALPAPSAVFPRYVEPEATAP